MQFSNEVRQIGSASGRRAACRSRERKGLAIAARAQHLKDLLRIAHCISPPHEQRKTNTGLKAFSNREPAVYPMARGSMTTKTVCASGE